MPDSPIAASATLQTLQCEMNTAAYVAIVQFEYIIQMMNEDAPNDLGESALLEQTITPPPSSNFDDLPIGGSKFTMSEFPSENDVPPPTKKIPLRKASKVPPKKQQPRKQNDEEPLSKYDDQPLKNNQPQPLDQLPVGGNKPSAFDQKPIGKSEFVMSEFPQGNQVLPAETNYTMMQKLKSKAAKMRLSGMEDLLKLLETEPDNPQIGEVQLAGLLKQTTPANIEKIVQCLKIWVQRAREWGEDEAKNAIQNGYINGKTNSRKITLETIDMMYEQKPAIIEMLIVTGLKNKTPKIIAGYNGLLNQILAIYGIKKMNYLKPYIPEVVRVITNEKLPAVKTEGLNTLKEAYKWLGKEVVEPMLNNLKEGLKKELDTFWETYDTTIVMTAPKQAKQEDGGKGKGKKVDAYDLSEAVDVFKKFNQKWAESVLKAEKWNERTRLMEEFIKGAAVPKFANTEFRHVSEVIRRLINDSNFNVVLWDLKLMGAMSKGLRKNFAPLAKSLFSNVIAKFRDKKTLMVEQTFKTLNDLNYCLGMEDVLDDVKEGLIDKAPNMRCNLLNWIGRHVEQKAEEKGGECPQKTRDAVRQLFPIFQKLVGDGVSEVRETMAKNLGKMQLILGEDFFSPIKTKLNKTLASKIGEVKNTEPKEKETATKNTKESTLKKGKELSESSVSLKPQTSTILNKKQEKETEKPPEKQKGEAPLQCYEEPNYEQCLTALIALGFPEQQVKNVTAAGAKERGNVLAYLKQNPYENFNAVIRVLRKAFKDWKEVNLMMNKDLIAYIEERVDDINKQELYVLVPYIVEKIGDSKFSEALYRIIADISKRVPGRYFVGHIIRYIRSTEGKKPKLNGDVCILLIRIIENISMSNCSLKELAEYAKQTYVITFSRKGAVELLNFLYSQVGDVLKGMLDEVTLKGMDGEFKNVKVLPEDQKRAKIEFEGQAAAEVKSMKKVQVKSEGKVRDLSAEVQQLMPKMNDNANWQNRKTAAQSLSNLIEQSGRVTLGNLTDLLATLKTRINDPNKQLIKVFVHLAGVVVCALPEKDARGNLKSFVTALVEGLNDKNEQNKKEIHLTLNKIADSFTREQLLAYMGPFLEGDREGRLEVINLILANEEGLQRAEIRDYPRGLVNCLSDKNKDIRAGAEKLFEKVYERIGLQTFRAIAKDQKIAVAKDLNTFLDKFDKQNRTLTAIQSKGNSPNKTAEIMANLPPTKSSRILIQQQQQPPPPQSAKKRSVSKYNPQKSFMEGEDDHPASNGSFFLPAKTSLVEGNQNFANIKILTQQRAERQSAQQSYIWRLDEIKQAQEQSVRQEIEKLVRLDLAKRLLAFDYKRVLEGAVQIMKLCKDVSHQGQIREIYDILFKYILLRLWGGNPGMLSLIELLPPIMSILEKKGIPLTDFQVELAITIIREYFISASMVGFKVSESLYSIVTCLIALSSGVKVLKKILRQFTLELNSIHKHLKAQTCLFYREGLSRLIKTQLIDYVGNEDLLQQASKIKELRQDPQFVEMLYRRLHSNVLDCFGFKRGQPDHSHSVNSSNNVKGNLVQVRASPINNSTLNEAREKSSDHLPPRGHQTTNTMMELRPSAAPTNSGSRKSIAAQQNMPPPPPAHTPPLPHQNSSFMSQTLTQQSLNQLMISPTATVTYEASTLDLSLYPAPHHACPLGKQLGKLLPPNDSTINFFNSLFTESGDKIVNELAVNAKIIFGSILKSVQEVISQRRTYAPDRIVAQITLFQNCIKCPHVVKNIGELLGFGASFALNQLVYEDENKATIYEELRARNIDYKSDNFIKAVNGVMLRLLQNANSQDIVNVLLELLTNQYRSQNSSPKLISLIVKCIGRVSSHFTRQMRSEATRLFLIRVIAFLFTVNYETPLQTLDTQQKESNGQKVRLEDSVASAIKSILIELCKAVNSQIWDYYDKAVAESQVPDRYISGFINFLNIRPVDRNSRSRSQQKQNEQLKKINELLSKTKSFEVGIAQLKKYISLHGQFNPLEYFTALNYDHKFIAMVISAIDGPKPAQRKTPLKDEKGEQTSENIQEKIKKLKQKFQQLQPEPQESQNSSMNRGRPAEQVQNEERAQEIRRRIEEMKNKMSTNSNNRLKP